MKQAARPSQFPSQQPSTSNSMPPKDNRDHRKISQIAQYGQDYQNNKGLPTGDLQFNQHLQQQHNKAERDAIKKATQKKRTANGYGAGPKPPPMQKLNTSTTFIPSAKAGASVSIGFHIVFNQTFFQVAQEHRVLVGVDTLDPMLLERTAERAHRQWPTSAGPSESIDQSIAIKLPQPSSVFNARFFLFGKYPGGNAKKKTMNLFRDPDLDSRRELVSSYISGYRGRSGDCPLEFIFNADLYFDEHPQYTRPMIPQPSSSQPASKKRKKMIDLTSSEEPFENDNNQEESILEHPPIKRLKTPIKARNKLSNLNDISNISSTSLDIISKPKRKTNQQIVVQPKTTTQEEQVDHSYVMPGCINGKWE